MEVELQTRLRDKALMAKAFGTAQNMPADDDL